MGRRRDCGQTERAALPETWEECGFLSRSRRLGTGQPGQVGAGTREGGGGTRVGDWDRGVSGGSGPGGNGIAEEELSDIYCKLPVWGWDAGPPPLQTFGRVCKYRSICE